MSDVTVPIVAAISAVIGSGAGAFAAIYARGRSDGRRDEVIERHERRLDDGTAKMTVIREQATATDKALAVLAETVRGVACDVEETRDLVREIAGKRRGT